MSDGEDAAKIKELWGRIEGYEHDPDDPNFLSEQTLRRYLLSRDWDVSAAKKQIKDTLEWRRETKPQHVVCAFCQTTPGGHAMRKVGFDKSGRPVIYTQCCTQHQPVDSAIQHQVYLLETPCGLQNMALTASYGSLTSKE
ncbi:phosphatidylinositol transfer protein 3-like [Dreissena polymorpha]|uniref:phosphatidylinositol transfer protein 3-like n=1 Tax=Dreissena polymorpha TaxID=45954 RepID=UPI00226549C7|nr:phosphatidylinositol transfer protein 3-like [Dreissena polymorpha]